jgi:hypothetical protein
LFEVNQTAFPKAAFMKIRYIHLILIVLISGFIGYSLGVNELNLKWKNYHPELSVINKEPPAGVKQIDFALFWQVWKKLEESYYDKKAIDPQKLYNGAISGMVAALDDPILFFCHLLETLILNKS